MKHRFSLREVGIRARYEANVGMQNHPDSPFVTMVVHRDEKAPVKDAAKVLAAAFADDPMMRYLQNELLRRRSLVPFFNYVVNSAIDHGSSVTLAYKKGEGPVAASVLEWPGTAEESSPYLLRHAVPNTLASFGISGLLRAISGSGEVHAKIDELKAAEGLYPNAAYLGYVGVIPEMQGQGAVKPVTVPGLQTADKLGIPILLVSSNPAENHDSFAKAGYVNIFDEATLYNNGRGPVNEYMAREPQSPTIE